MPKPHNSPHPASPSRPPICCVYLTFGERRLIVPWGTIAAGKAMVDRAIDNQSFKWLNTTTIETDDGMKIMSYHLEEIIECEDLWALPDHDCKQVDRLRLTHIIDDIGTKGERRRQHGDTGEKYVKESSSRRPTPISREGLITLAAICAELGIEPSEARKTLRKKEIVKPAGGWAWEAAKVAEVKAVLK